MTSAAIVMKRSVVELYLILRNNHKISAVKLEDHVEVSYSKR